jgi:hypothetical protein
VARPSGALDGARSVSEALALSKLGRHKPLRSPRTLEARTTQTPPKPSRSRPAAARCGPRSLAPLAPCGPCVAGAGSRALALRQSTRTGTALPFPESRGLASARHAFPARRPVRARPSRQSHGRALAAVPAGPAADTVRGSRSAATNGSEHRRRLGRREAHGGRLTTILAESPKGEPARPSPDDVSTAAERPQGARRGAQRVPAGRAGEGFGSGSVETETTGTARASEGFESGSVENEHTDTARAGEGFGTGPDELEHTDLADGSRRDYR